MAFEETLARLAESSKLLTGDLILENCGTTEKVSYRKTDFLSHGGVWRGLEVPPAISETFSGTLIFGHSDLAISAQERDLLSRKNPELKVVWSMNIPTDAPDFKALPIGLTNDTSESKFHSIFGNQKHISAALEEENRSQPGVVASFNWRTSARARLRLMLQSKINPIISWTDPEFSVRGRIRYLRAIRKAGFALCPRGNGLDTHRIWETLAVGAIPILLSRHVPGWMKSEAAIPRIELKSWSQVTSLDLIELQQSMPPIDPYILSADYWWEKIIDSAK